MAFDGKLWCLHENNIEFKETLEKMIFLCIQISKPEKAYEYCQLLNKMIEKHWYKFCEGDLSPLRGVYLYMAGKLASHLEKFEEAVYFLTEAQKILTTTHQDVAMFLTSLQDQLLGNKQALMNSQK